MAATNDIRARITFARIIAVGGLKASERLRFVR
jgi:hypothetical protein